MTARICQLRSRVDHGCNTTDIFWTLTNIFSDTNLEQAGEDVKLEVGDVVIAGEVYRGLERHGLQPRADGVHLVQGQSEQLPRHDCSFTETSSPKVGSITFSNSECITGERSVREDRFKFTKHVAENQTEFCQVPPVVGILIEQLLLAFFK